MRFFLISGSVSNPAHTTALIEEVADRLRKKGFEAIVWDLRKCPLPIADPMYHNEPEKNTDETVRSFVYQARYSDAFVLGSPNYHNSYSGVLKNALDILNMDIFRNKPVGLVGNGGGMRSTQPLDHLRIVVRGLLGVAIPIQVASCKSDYILVGDQYKVKAIDLINRLELFTEQLVDYTIKLK
ncbi:NADPH-dependent FMN reductase [Brevibacillus sp. GCM10020057]|uniref:NADPH-dependent FMN reductase n=1 Tax=Brevibacillus sp. GCM10020057 TaxID=3317327 RepID=UPI0036327AAF